MVAEIMGAMGELIPYNEFGYLRQNRDYVTCMDIVTPAGWRLRHKKPLEEAPYCHLTFFFLSLSAIFLSDKLEE